MSLQAYCWIFMFLYIGVMIWFGILGQRKVTNADDFATARGSYGPWFLALAFTSTVASGATFLGIPGLAYTFGLSAMWIMFCYPLGAYTGVLVCQRMIARAGETFGNRSIPEYLGCRYNSEAMRVIAAIFSLILLFYMAGQLVSGVVMFETMLGLDLPWALGITTVVLATYVVMGGAHADMMTDALQGFVMILLAIMLLIMFVFGFGFDGGLSGAVAQMEDVDPKTTKVLYEGSPVVGEWWHIFALLFVHVPLGLMPHVGNKLWALKREADRRKFIIIAFTFGLILPCMAFGGMLARGMFGDDLFSSNAGANNAVPALFIEIFPTWLAALLGVGILAAIMSTADGLVIAMSQVIANDLYRLTYAPKYHQNKSESEIDLITLRISRLATVAVLAASVILAYNMQNMNISLLVALGFGGLSAALWGPLVLGVMWRGLTKAGAIAGFLSGASTFVIIAGGFITASGPDSTTLYSVTSWIERQIPNAFSVGTIGGLVCIIVAVVVSKVTPPLPDDQLNRVFGSP
ncbi:MAG: sodium:solute symporter [Rhodospirillaceae bacterium]